jgi:hypothetical protein
VLLELRCASILKNLKNDLKEGWEKFNTSDFGDGEHDRESVVNFVEFFNKDYETQIEEAEIEKFKPVNNKMESWGEQLFPIIEEYKDGDEDALDGDAVDDIVEIIRAIINLQEGNITEEEYYTLLER